jgi:hypothetical protein
MPKTRHPWKRFWCIRGGTFNLADNGYLVDPDGEYGAALNPGLASADSFYEQPCVILLGEPGIGKTDGVKSIQASEAAAEQANSHKFLSFDLRSYGSEERFIKEVLASEAIEDWIHGTTILHLFLDSLDEALLRLDTVSAILGERIPEFPTERLRLRIACRTAEWPTTLEDSLLTTWGKELVKAYELVPLRKKDVKASLPSGFDPDAFIRQIELAHAVPLAIKPITLNFLTNLYINKGSFPSNQSELYLSGCRILCEENNDFRRDSNHRHSLSADQRLMAAMRIAAATVFSNRNAIWTGPEQGDELPEDLILRTISGGVESIGESKLEVDEAALRETLGTGLFSSRGVQRLGWAHQTYAEFLAARYLFERRLTIDQINSLIFHGGEPASKMVPQLGETSAWLASMVPEVFSEIVAHDPEILLRSDVSALTDIAREALANALLTATDNEHIYPVDLSVRTNLGKLSHPNLAAQLTPYISQTAKCELSRNLAIDIAQACRVTSLSENLATVALDRSQPISIRINAAHAVARVGEQPAKARLKPLATEDQDDDENDELKGCALQAAWPHSLNSEDLFRLITPLKSPSMFGAYRGFIDYQLAEQLRASDLPAALAWLEQEGRAPGYDPFGNLGDAIILKAWENLETEGISKALAKAILPRLRSQHRIFSHAASRQEKKIILFRSDLASDDSKRRLLLGALVQLLQDMQNGEFYIMSCDPGFVLRGDFFYLLDLVIESVEPKLKRFLSTIIGRLFDWGDRKEVDAILVAAETDFLIAEAMAWMIKPIELNSPLAEQMKREFKEIMELKEKRSEQFEKTLTPSPAERVLKCLDEIESGKSAAW